MENLSTNEFYASFIDQIRKSTNKGLRTDNTYNQKYNYKFPNKKTGKCMNLPNTPATIIIDNKKTKHEQVQKIQNIINQELALDKKSKEIITVNIKRSICSPTSYEFIYDVQRKLKKSLLSKLLKKHVATLFTKPLIFKDKVHFNTEINEIPYSYYQQRDEFNKHLATMTKNATGLTVSVTSNCDMANNRCSFVFTNANDVTKVPKCFMDDAHDE